MAKKLKVFVTGATGFVGSNIIRRLVFDNKYEVHIIYRSSSKSWRIQDILSLLYTHSVDITDKKKLQKVIRKIQPDIIFHLANIGVYGGFEGEPEDVIRVNLVGTINLIEAAKEVPYRCFVNTGSSSEYGPKLSSMREDDYCKPESIYAISKLAATIYALQEAKRYNKPLVCIRLFSPFGPYDDRDRLMSYVIRQSLIDEPLLLHTKNAVRDYVYIDDVVDAYMQCIKRIKYVRGEILNIGSGSQVKVSEVVKIACSVTGSKSKVSWGNKISKRYESKIWKADIKKANKLLHWKPKTSLREGIKKAAEYVENKNLLKG